MQEEIIEDLEGNEKVMKERAPKNVVPIMTGVLLGVLLSALDSSIVSPAMPQIAKDLKESDHYSWPFTAYMIMSTLAIPIAGKMADSYGRKRVFNLGILIFIMSSIACGFSTSMVQLVVFRGLQGVGGGVILSSAFTVVGQLFGPKERGKYMGLLSAMFGIASVIGPSLGGLITEAPSMGWPWIFFVNVPLGALAFIIIWKYMPDFSSSAQKGKAADVKGIVAFIFCLTPLLLALEWGGNEYAWGSWQVLSLLAAFTVMVLVFIRFEQEAESPMMPMYLFKSRLYNLTIVISFISAAASFAVLVFLPLFVSAVKGKSVEATGQIITPYMLSFVFAAILIGRIASSTGKYKLIITLGFVVVSVGCYLFSLMTAETETNVMVANMIILGLGMGIATPTTTLMIQSVAPLKDMGVITSGLAFFRNMGSSIGIAALSTIMIGQFGTDMKGVKAEDFQQNPEVYRKIQENPQLLLNEKGKEAVKAMSSPKEFAKVEIQRKSALSSSIIAVYITTTGMTILGLGLSLLLRVPKEKEMKPAIE